MAKKKKRSFWSKIQPTAYETQQRNIERDQQLDKSQWGNRIQEQYANNVNKRPTATHNTPASGTPDNNSPGINVDLNREEDREMTDVTPRSGIITRKSPWASDNAKNREEAPENDYGLDAADVSNWSVEDIDRVYQKMVDEGKIEAEFAPVTTQKRQKILGILGGAR